MAWLIIGGFICYIVRFFVFAIAIPKWLAKKIKNNHFRIFVAIICGSLCILNFDWDIRFYDFALMMFGGKLAYMYLSMPWKEASTNEKGVEAGKEEK
jgi:hypothetical protein